MKRDPREQRFADEYLVDFNGQAAAIRAGYSPKGAAVQASRLLSRANVQEQIRAAQDKLRHKTQITQERVLAELVRIAFLDPATAFDADGKLLPVPRMPEDLRRALSSIEIRSLGDEGTLTKIRFWSKDSAIEKLCKHLGLYREELHLSGKIEVGQVEDLTDEQLLAVVHQSAGRGRRAAPPAKRPRPAA